MRRGLLIDYHYSYLETEKHSHCDSAGGKYNRCLPGARRLCMPALIWQVSGPEGIFPLGCVYITYLRIFLSRGKAVGGRRRRYVGPAQRAGDARPGGRLSRPAFDPQPTG